MYDANLRKWFDVSQKCRMNVCLCMHVDVCVNKTGKQANELNDKKNVTMKMFGDKIVTHKVETHTHIHANIYFIASNENANKC